MNIEEGLGKAIKHLRNLMGLTQGQLSEIIDVPQSQLSMLERGRANKRVSLVKLEKLAVALGLERLSDLLLETECMIYPEKGPRSGPPLGEPIPITIGDTTFYLQAYSSVLYVK